MMHTRPGPIVYDEPAKITYIGPPQKPLFCGQCGLGLVEYDGRETRYNEQTGRPYKVGSVLLRCPNYLPSGLAARHTNRLWSEPGDTSVTWYVNKKALVWDRANDG